MHFFNQISNHAKEEEEEDVNKDGDHVCFVYSYFNYIKIACDVM